ncbi:carboxypeptidase-like regulatory domain-containing protein, partial [Acidobacteria bacterium AH-259-A15]|nr:carboxypeptidase-like regulatory domain-containing protein [Acidobacteria bacterium AH-259-A15]
TQGASGEVFVDTFGTTFASPGTQAFTNIQQATQFNFTLGAGMQISGTVTDANAAGVANVFVGAFNQSTGFLGGAETDANGAYSFAVTEGASGEVFVDTFGTSFASPGTQAFTNIQQATQFNFTLGAGVQISGTVTDPNAAGVANVYVGALNGGLLLGGSFTDSNGAYSFKVAQGASGEVAVDTFGTTFAPPTTQAFTNIQQATQFNFTLAP